MKTAARDILKSHVVCSYDQQGRRKEERVYSIRNLQVKGKQVQAVYCEML